MGELPRLSPEAVAAQQPFHAIAEVLHGDGPPGFLHPAARVKHLLIGMVDRMVANDDGSAQCPQWPVQCFSDSML
jgi:hypothetical protein